MCAEALAFVLPLGLDSFAVAAAIGAAQVLTVWQRLRISLVFVIFEGWMPLIGLGLGAALALGIGPGRRLPGGRRRDGHRSLRRVSRMASRLAASARASVSKCPASASSAPGAAGAGRGGSHLASSAVARACSVWRAAGGCK
jgi:hypothetical protein